MPNMAREKLIVNGRPAGSNRIYQTPMYKITLLAAAYNHDLAPIKPSTHK